MKLLKFSLLLLFAIFSMTSCSDETIDSPVQNNNSYDGNYFPSNESDYWKYNVESTNNDTNETTTSNDSLYVATEAAAQFTLNVNDNMIANGLTNGLLTSGELSRTATTLSLNGALELPPELSDLIDFEITLDNVILYNVNANNGVELSSTSNTITQDFNGFPVTINYSFTTIAQGFLDSYTVSGDNYENVTATKLQLNLSISTTVTVGPITIDVPIINPANVLVSTNYFAENIGLIQSTANLNLELSAEAITLLENAGVEDVPTSISTSNTQELTDYFISE